MLWWKITSPFSATVTSNIGGATKASYMLNMTKHRNILLVTDCSVDLAPAGLANHVIFILVRICPNRI